MTLFKIGDTVEYIETGELGTVIEIDRDAGGPDFGILWADGDESWAEEEDLRHAAPLAKGDVVTLTADIVSNAMENDVLRNLTENCSPNFYQVFEAQSNDMFDYDIALPVYQHSNLSWAHGAAYDLWKANPSKRYTIIQPYNGSCAGGYGFSDRHSEATELKIIHLEGPYYMVVDPVTNHELYTDSYEKCQQFIVDLK